MGALHRIQYDIVVPEKINFFGRDRGIEYNIGDGSVSYKAEAEEGHATYEIIVLASGCVELRDGDGALVDDWDPERINSAGVNMRIRNAINQAEREEGYDSHEDEDEEDDRDDAH